MRLLMVGGSEAGEPSCPILYMSVTRRSRSQSESSNRPSSRHGPTCPDPEPRPPLPVLPISSRLRPLLSNTALYSCRLHHFPPCLTPRRAAPVEFSGSGVSRSDFVICLSPVRSVQTGAQAWNHNDRRSAQLNESSFSSIAIQISTRTYTLPLSIGLIM